MLGTCLKLDEKSFLGIWSAITCGRSITFDIHSLDPAGFLEDVRSILRGESLSFSFLTLDTNTTSVFINR